MEGHSSWILLKSPGLLGCREIPFSGLIVVLGLICSHSLCPMHCLLPECPQTA